METAVGYNRYTDNSFYGCREFVLLQYTITIQGQFWLESSATAMALGRTIRSALMPCNASTACHAQGVSGSAVRPSKTALVKP